MKLDVATYIDTHSEIVKNLLDEIGLYVDEKLPSEASEDFEDARNKFDDFYIRFRAWANKQD
jgi:hypothetical protein